MNRAALAIVVAAAAVVCPCLFSHGSADEKPRRDEPIPLSEVHTRGILGRLGCKLGEIVTVEGVIEKGTDAQGKWYSGKTLLHVHTVNAKLLEEHQIFFFEMELGAKAGKPKTGSKFRYLGYETGGYLGTPDGTFKYVQPFAARGYGFSTTFVILREEKGKK